jgi:DNA-binding LytR/AlgR family response regulator
LLLDDELPALSYMKVLCEQLPDVEVVKAFNEPQLFLDSINNLNFNACILDIQMPGISGLEVAQKLSGKAIIFTTAYKEYAAEAFDLHAVDYLRKPIQKERLEQAILKAKTFVQNQQTSEKKQVIWNTDRGKTLINFDEVLYITASETDSRDKITYLKDSQKLTIKNISFDTILSVLPAGQFARINKKDVIALKTLVHYTADEVKTNIQLKPDQFLSLPLSDVYRDDFRLKLPL